jgi:hypothetical protein
MSRSLAESAGLLTGIAEVASVKILLDTYCYILNHGLLSGF